MSLKVNFIARLGKDAEVFTTKSKTYISFTCATQENSSKDSPTIWLSAYADLERFKNVQPYLTKGKMLQITGSLRCNLYHANNGSEGIDYKVSVDSLDFVPGGKRDENATANAAAANQMTTGGLRPSVSIPTPAPLAAPVPNISPDEVDLPF